MLAVISRHPESPTREAVLERVRELMEKSHDQTQVHAGT